MSQKCWRNVYSEWLWVLTEKTLANRKQLRRKRKLQGDCIFRSSAQQTNKSIRITKKYESFQNNLNPMRGGRGRAGKQNTIKKDGLEICLLSPWISTHIVPARHKYFSFLFVFNCRESLVYNVRGNYSTDFVWMANDSRFIAICSSGLFGLLSLTKTKIHAALIARSMMCKKRRMIHKNMIHKYMFWRVPPWWQEKHCSQRENQWKFSLFSFQCIFSRLLRFPHLHSLTSRALCEILRTLFIRAFVGAFPTSRLIKWYNVARFFAGEFIFAPLPVPHVHKKCLSVFSSFIQVIQTFSL